MSAQTKEVGGGPASGLADSFVKWLSQGMNTGTFGAGSPAGGDAVGATQGISGYLNDVLSGGAGKLGGAMGTMIGKETDRGVAAIRARFGVGGGTAFGTPAANAEALFRSEEAPKLATAVGGLQQNALAMLLPIFAQMAGKGIAQKELVTQPNPWVSAASTVAQGASAAAPYMAASRGVTTPTLPSAGPQVSMVNSGWQMPSIQPLNFTPSLPWS